MEYRHLHEHAVARFGYDDAARTVEYVILYDDTAAHRQTMHKLALGFGVVEPTFFNAPMQQVFSEFEIGLLVTVVSSRRPRFGINNVGACSGFGSIIGFGDAAA